jgi:hypothetical protein
MPPHERYLQVGFEVGDALTAAEGTMFSRSAARDALVLDDGDEKPKRNEVEVYRHIAALLDDRGPESKASAEQNTSGCVARLRT